MSEHPGVETLSAFVDGELGDARSVRVHAHLRACSACAARVERVRSLAAAARALPREIAPPPESWTALRNRLARERLAARAPRRWWHDGRLAAAAALVLVVGTSVIARQWGGERDAAARDSVAAGVRSGIETPAVLAVDGNYARTLADLRAALQAQRSSLSPQTVRVVERSLVVIDSAIAEARAALASDPANGVLVDILAAQYERKVDLLQRATRLSSEL